MVFFSTAFHSYRLIVRDGRLTSAWPFRGIYSVVTFFFMLVVYYFTRSEQLEYKHPAYNCIISAPWCPRPTQKLIHNNKYYNYIIHSSISVAVMRRLLLLFIYITAGDFKNCFRFALSCCFFAFFSFKWNGVNYIYFAFLPANFSPRCPLPPPIYM